MSYNRTSQYGAKVSRESNGEGQVVTDSVIQVLSCTGWVGRVRKGFCKDNLGVCLVCSRYDKKEGEAEVQQEREGELVIGWKGSRCKIIVYVCVHMCLVREKVCMARYV